MHKELILVLAGLLGGSINAIAGGGAILMFPALLFVGLAPINATATISLAVLPGAVAAVAGYKKQLKTVSKYFLWLLVPCVLGAIIGAQILIHISPKTFESIVPWLVLSAVILLAMQTQIHKALVSKKHLVKATSQLAMPILYVSAFLLSIYGGFFGVGFGLMFLAFLGFSKLKNNYQISAIKNLCGVGITSIAAFYFINSGLINVRYGLLIALGSAIGGYSGAKLSQKVSLHAVHDLTLVIGILITIFLFLN